MKVALSGRCRHYCTLHTGSYCQLAALVGSPLHVYAERQLCQKLHILRAMEAHQSADVLRGDS
jgi:hypothetical protein